MKYHIVTVLTLTICYRYWAQCRSYLGSTSLVHPIRQYVAGDFGSHGSYDVMPCVRSECPVTSSAA